MAERPTATTRHRCAIPGCDAAARLYPCGWRCTTHGPTPQPTPPPGTTLADLRAATTSTTYSAALAAEHERRRRLRDEARAW